MARKKKKTESATVCTLRNQFCGLPAGTPYKCRTKSLGLEVPREGARITGCSVPPKGKENHRHYELRTALGLSYPMKASTADNRLRRQRLGLKTVSTAVEVLQEAAYRWRRGEIDPQPLGVEFPHIAGSSRCDPEHSAWSNWDESNAQNYSAVMDECMSGFESRQSAKRTGHAGTSRERARYKKAAQYAGEDVTSGEFLDESERLFGTGKVKRSIHRIKHF